MNLDEFEAEALKLEPGQPAEQVFQETRARLK